MNRESNETRPPAVARVVHHGIRRDDERAVGRSGKRHFQLGEWVRALISVSNDGIYPHRDIGEILVFPGDAGFIREDWSFLGEVYYTVEFVSRAVIVINRHLLLDAILQTKPTPNKLSDLFVPQAKRFFLNWYGRVFHKKAQAECDRILKEAVRQFCGIIEEEIDI